MTVELIAYRRLRHAPRLAPLITAIGASFILQNVGLAWKGPNYVQTASVLPTGTVFSTHGVEYTWEKLIVLIVTTPVLLILVWLVQHAGFPGEGKTAQEAFRRAAVDAFGK